MPDRKLRVFLCHASQDKPIVRELYHRLLAEGWIDPWLDEEKLLPGQDWDMEIEKAVETSDAVIVCLSNNSVNKEGYVQKEIRFVLDISLGKPEAAVFEIPIRINNCEVPRRLRSKHYLDYFPSEQRNERYLQLLNSLQLRANSLGFSLSKEVVKKIPTKISRSKTTKLDQSRQKSDPKDRSPNTIHLRVRVIDYAGNFEGEYRIGLSIDATVSYLIEWLKSNGKIDVGKDYIASYELNPDLSLGRVALNEDVIITVQPKVSRSVHSKFRLIQD